MIPVATSGSIDTTEIVTMTDAARLREKAIDFWILDGSKQKTTAAPTQVDAPAKHERVSGKTHDDVDKTSVLPSVMWWLLSAMPVKESISFSEDNVVRDRLPRVLSVN
mmetsp:Transcript_6662/g.14479  ORF Transcript_6662/g.14479 Transcript_6662/m.14479 type:complete len:108 (-) Transcript_6662:177-500(-)